MDIYYAIRGPKRGAFFDYTEDGLEEMTLTEKNGKEIPAGYTGLIIPFSALADDVIRIGRRGQGVDEKVYENLRR